MVEPTVRVVVSQDLLDALRDLRDTRDVQRRFLLAAGREVQRIARDRYLRGPRPHNLGRVTGTLSRSIALDESGLPDRVEIGTPLVYGPPHEFGATIVPRRARLLVFRVGPEAHLGRGEFVAVPRVRIPERPFMGPALEDASTRFEDILHDELEREVLG